MSKKLILILMFLNLAVLPAVAQDGDVKRDKPPVEGDRARFDKMKMMMERFKKENPGKAKELEELRESNPEEFRRRVRELIFQKMGDHDRGDHDRGGHWLNEMKEKDPEKFKKLMELREKDPEAFRKKMVQEYGERFRKSREEFDKTRKEIGELLKKYNEAASEEEKSSIKGQLKEKLTESFKKDLERRNDKVQKLEKYLVEIKEQIEERESNQESLINEQLEYLIQGKFRRDGDSDHHKNKDSDPKKEVERQ